MASHSRPSKGSQTEPQRFAALASELATSFVSGHVADDTAATLRNLFPEATLVSLSVLAGGKLLISERNLVEAGFAKVSFERIIDTTAGQALARNRACTAELNSESSSSCLDLVAASKNYACQTLVSAPISRRGRRASFELEMRPRSAPTFEERRSSISSDSRYNWCAVEQWAPTNLPNPNLMALGSLTVGLPSDAQLSSTHLKNLFHLSKSLGPLLWHCGHNIILGLETLFCQPQLFGIEEKEKFVRQSSIEPAWGSAEFVDNFVDALICRNCSADSLCTCKQQDMHEGLLPFVGLPEPILGTACPS